MTVEYALLAVAALALFLGSLFLLARSAHRRDLRKKAQTHLQWNDLVGAARLFEAAGDRSRAASLYRDGGERLKAVRLHLALKDFDATVEALRGSRPEEVQTGFELLSKARALEDRSRAALLAAIAQTAGLAGLSASLFDKAGRGEEARAARLQEARSLAAQGKPLEAAALYEKLGEVRPAAAAHAEAARRQTEPDAKRALARRAAELLRSVNDLHGAAEALAVGGEVDSGVELLLTVNDFAGAAEILQWHNRHREAAQLFEKVGNFRAAARALGLAGDMRQSAVMLEKAGDALAAVRMLLDAGDPRAAADVHLRAGSTAAAAEILASAGEVDTAVNIYLSANDLDNAVELLRKRSRLRDAAALLTARGENHRAAVLLAESGDLTQKARLLESTGDLEGAAQAWLDLGKPQEARAALSSIENLSPVGRFLLARACRALQDHDKAAQLFTSLLGGPPRGLRRADILYELACSFEALHRIGEAIATLEEIVAEDASYQDAAFRVKLLRARFGSGGAPIPLIQEVSGTANTTPTPAATVPPAWSSALDPRAPSATAAPEQAARVHRGFPERYVVEKELGRGAMGVVYRALDTSLDRPVAIKVLEHHASDPKMRVYFLREARAVAQLIHPNIVTLFDAGLEGLETPYLIMELVEGNDLRTRLQKGPLLSMRESLVLGAGVAAALDCAHGRNVIHRDVKPENILVAPDGSAKLMDFGVAHVMRSGERQATVIGTPVYMAPEQIKGEAIGGFTDIYALGVVLFECLTGAPPFDADGAFHHHVNTPPPDPRLMRSDIPAPLAEAVLRCLAKAPAARFASAKTLSETLFSLANSVQAA